MAPAPSASAFPLHPNSCLLDEHDRMLFQHSHPTGTDAERTTLQEGVEGFSAAISKAIQPQSHALHLDQRAGTLPTHHRSNERVPGSSFQATKAAEDVWSKISNALKRLGFRSHNFLAQLLSQTARACTIRVRRSTLGRLWNDLGSHAGLHHRKRRPGTSTEERISGRREPDPESPNQRQVVVIRCRKSYVDRKST